MRYSSIEDGGSPLGPLTIPASAQYVAGNIQIGSINAQTRILGLSHAIVDTGDPVVVDVTHTKGPLLMDVTHTAHPTVCDTCQFDPSIVTRHLGVRVLDMPATARVSYSPSTGDYTYGGSGVIDHIYADLTSSVPLADDADESHLHLAKVPTGLTGRVNTAAETFTAHITDGSAIETVEAQVTSGDNERLPDGVDGLMLHDHDGKYVAFVRISGLSDATVGWGDTKFATVTHRAGRFVMDVDADDPDSEADALTVSGNITDLPAVAHVEYTPARPAQITPKFLAARPSTFIYSGSALIEQMTFDVVMDEPLNDTGITTIKVLAKGVPGVTLVHNPFTEETTATTNPKQSLRYLWVEACAPNGCRLGLPPAHDDESSLSDPDLITVIDLDNQQYDVTALVRGLSRFTANIDRNADGELTAAGVGLTHDSGPMEIITIADKVDIRVEPGTITHPLPTIVRTPYVETAHVIARNLPASLDFYYSMADQRVDYLNASGPIVILDIKYSKGVVPIAGRAHYLHVVAHGVRPGLSLTYDFGPNGNDIVLDAGSTKIGRLDIDLLSSPSVATKPAILHNKIIERAEDGLIFWDLHDQNPAEDLVLDPYILMARVTNLQKFSYHTDSTTYEGGETFSNLGVDATRLGGGPTINVEIVKDHADKPSQPLEGFGNTYEYEYIAGEYHATPDEFGFSFRTREGTGPKQYWVDVWGSGQGGKVGFKTNAGSIKNLVATVDVVPAGTPLDPGIKTCISPNVMSCVEPQYDNPRAKTTPVSITAEVRSPIKVDVDIAVGDMRVVVNARIEKRLFVGKEGHVETCCPNSQFIYLDTAGYTVDGHVLTYDEGDFDTEVIIPIGTRAYNRYVEVENVGVNDSRNRGFLLCPAGFNAHTSVFGIDVSLNDDVCTSSVITSVVGGPVPSDGTPTIVQIYGSSFVSPTVHNGVLHPGTVITTLPFNDVVISDVIWWGPDHMQATITAGPGAIGPHTLHSINPTESRMSQDSPAYCVCGYEVT